MRISFETLSLAFSYSRGLMAGADYYASLGCTLHVFQGLLCYSPDGGETLHTVPIFT